MKKLLKILVVTVICLLFYSTNLCYSQVNCPHFKIAESVEGERVAYMKPLKCLKLDLDLKSQDNVMSYDIDNDGFDEKVGYSSREGSSVLNFKIEGLNPNGGIVHKFEIDYFPEHINEQENGVWVFLADIYGDALPEVLVFSYFVDKGCSLVVPTFSNDRFIDRIFSLNADDGVTHMYVKNQKLVRNYSSYGDYQSLTIELYNLKVKNCFDASWEVYVDGDNYGKIESKRSKTFGVPTNSYKKIDFKQITTESKPIVLTFTRNMKPLVGQDVNCNIETYFLQITNTHSDPRNVYVDGQYFGQVAGRATDKIEVLTSFYKNIKLEQSKGYLLSPNVENFTLQYVPKVNAVIDIKN